MHRPLAMRLSHVLLMVSVTSVAAACGPRGPELRDVGVTMVTSARSRHSPQPDPSGRDGGAAAPDDAAKSVEGYVTGKGTGPCGMDQLPMIAFAFGSGELDEAKIPEVQRLAGCLTTAPYDTSSVVLVGHSDVVGDAPANLSLGLERAEAVMKQLIEGGVSAARIVVASAGELQRPRARWGMQADRVEVLVARGGPPRPDEPPIARGIDARGLMPSPPRNATSGAPPARPVPPARPPFLYGTPPPGYVPPARR